MVSPLESSARHICLGTENTSTVLHKDQDLYNVVCNLGTGITSVRFTHARTASG